MSVSLLELLQAAERVRETVDEEMELHVQIGGTIVGLTMRLASEGLEMYTAMHRNEIEYGRGTVLLRVQAMGEEIRRRRLES